jgi:hypothetical protein
VSAGQASASAGSNAPAESSGTESGAAPASASAPNDVLKRLREKREQENQ